jgi:hypothetical protein
MTDWRDQLTGWQVSWFVVLVLIPLPIGPWYVTIPAVIVFAGAWVVWLNATNLRR